MSVKILVADDDRNIAELLRLYLVKEGYTAVLAADGEEAFELFQRENPDLILLDLMMPKMDGRMVCQKIRETSQVPIIMLTAKGEVYDRIQGLELGADDYVVKPFDAKEVMARIKAVLRRASPEEKSAEGVYDLITSTWIWAATSCGWAARWWKRPPRSWSCWPAFAATPTASTPATSFWTRCGGLSITATAAPSTFTSSACAKSWRAPATSGSSRPSGAWATSLRSRNKLCSEKV